MIKIIRSFLFVCFILLFFGCEKEEKMTKKDQKSVDIVLDYTPNTNHTGLFVALENGYFDDILVNIKKAPEDSTSDLVITGKAAFGIYFQESMGAKLAKGAPITAVAAIINHNTSGILSLKDKNIKSPKDMQDTKYGSWGDPVEMYMIKYLLQKEGKKEPIFVPNVDVLSINSLKNGLFDSCWVYYAWDGVMAETMGIKTNFFYLKDSEKSLDYYSPIIIANNDFLKQNPKIAKKVIQAIKKGYIYAIKNPKKAADILIKYAPELQNKRDFIYKSQYYLSKQYAQDAKKWGEIDPNRWNDFYIWLNKSGVLKDEIPLNVGFSNEFLQ